MSAPVDVLFTMAEAGRRHNMASQLKLAEEMNEARDAVAELIAVANKARDRLWASGFRADSNVADDLTAALARVGGAK